MAEQRKTYAKFLNMQVFINLKQIGKRRNVIDRQALTLVSAPATVAELIAAVVCRQVEEYNDRLEQSELLNCLTDDQVRQKAVAGKIGFGELYNQASAQAEKAVHTALQAFEDGIFRLFVNETEVAGLRTALTLNEGDTLTFIRLTLLTGRLW